MEVIRKNAVTFGVSKDTVVFLTFPQANGFFAAYNEFYSVKSTEKQTPWNKEDIWQNNNLL